jgi:T5SS/PEP-CTERM-associated repeat protein
MALITGTNSLWSNAGSFSLGNCGSDSLLVVSNGGGVVSSNGYIAEVSRWTNCSAVITGSGSFWSNTGTLTIGSLANGGNNPSSGNSLIISDGGRVTGSTAVIANATNFFSNSVTVTGINSLWSNSGSVDLGVLGSLNVLVISNGGTVIATGIIETNGTTDGPLAVAATIGYSNASSNNSILITGTNSAMTNAGRLRIGYEGSGNLVTITNGGQLIGTRNANITIGYGTNSSNNSLVISGPGSLSSNNGGIYVGYYGSSNMLTLTDGAVIRSGSTNAAFYGSSTNYNDAYVGFGSSSSNNAVLIDGNAQWIHSGTNYIGYGGSGTVTVANGGVLAAAKILIGQYGDLDFGRYLQSDSAGSVVGDIVFTSNNDENFGINFNQTNTFNFSNNVSGPGWICALGTGTTIMSGSNSYSQYTIIDAGTIVVASTNALGTGYLQIGGTSDKATLILATNLSVADFNWGSNGVVALTSGSQILTVDALTNLAVTIGGNVFDFLGGGSSLILNNNTNALINFTSQSGFTTNSFSVLGVTGYSFSTNDNRISSYISTSANVGVSTAITINGTLVVNSLTVNPSGTLQGTGTLSLTGGNLSVNGTFAPGNIPGTFFVIGGNLVMGSSSVWDQQIYSTSVYDRVVVTGSAILNGTMNISTDGVTQLQFGQKNNFLTASGGISGAFSSIIAPEGFRGRLFVRGTQANLLIAPVSYTQLAQNQNQLNVATALNSFIPYTSGDQQVVSTALDSLTASQYNQAFNAIMPTFYQQIATIAFNQANAQNMELNQRLWGLRVAEGGGFSMSGIADNYAMLQEGIGDGPSKGVLDSKQDILRPGFDNHWGMFVDGNGIFAQANSGNMLPGYNSESGGVTTGLTYKWNKNVASGIYAGYQGSYTKSGANGSGLGTGSSLIDNAVRFGVFGTYGQENGKGLYANALAGGAYHNMQATRVIQFTGLNRTANSSPGAGELDTMLATGYDLQKGKFTFGPTASLQYTYLGVNSVNETGAQSLNFNSGGWNSSSMLSSLGAHAAYNWQAGRNILVVPQISLNWQHEFMQNPYAISGNLGGTSPTFSNWSVSGIRDYLYTGVGFTVEFGKRWNTSFFYNAAAGNSDLVSQNIFWSAGVKF